jgi:hypothetical protein
MRAQCTYFVPTFNLAPYWGLSEAAYAMPLQKRQPGTGGVVTCGCYLFEGIAEMILKMARKLLKTMAKN